MLVQSCRALVVGVMTSTIEHKREGMSCFAWVQFGNRMVVGYYSGTLVYACTRVRMVIRIWIV